MVTAPQRASMGKIHEALEKHARWVRKKVAELRDAPPPPPPARWVEGEPHRFLGRDYALRLLEGEGKAVWLTDDELLVLLPAPGGRETVRRLVEDWMLEEARVLFRHRMEVLVRSTASLGIREAPILGLRRMKSRWGSCSPRGRILMNTHAVKLPLRLVDYILMHELCHLKVPNHGPAFWAHLSDCMPDWPRRKRALDRQGV